MINTVVVAGRLGADPRITEFESGGKAAQFSIAVTERGYKRQDGTEVPERTEWIRVETGHTGIAGVVEKYLKKGSFVVIDGRLRNREWEKDGVKHYATVVLIENLELCPKNGEQQNGTPPPEQEQSKVVKNSVTNHNTGAVAATNMPVYSQDDDLPF